MYLAIHAFIHSEAFTEHLNWSIIMLDVIETERKKFISVSQNVVWGGEQRVVHYYLIGESY
jgi:hypothetical protein